MGLFKTFFRDATDETKKIYLNLFCRRFITLSSIIILSQAIWGQADLVRKGDYYLKGKSGYEKNEVLAKLYYQRAVDEGYKAGVKKLKKMGITPPERSSLATGYDNRGYGTSLNAPIDTPDDEVLMVAWGKNPNYSEAVDQALRDVISEAEVYAGAGCKLISYHLLCTVEAGDTCYVTLQARVKLPAQEAPNATFKVNDNKRKNDIRYGNIVSSFRKLYNALYHCIPYAAKTEVNVEKTAGPFIKGLLRVSYSDMQWQKMLDILPTLALSKEEQNRVSEGCIRVEWDYNFWTFTLPKSIITKEYNPVFAFSSNYTIAYANCLPDYYIVTEETVHEIPLEESGKIMDANVVNSTACFFAKNTPIEVPFTIMCTPAQFDKITSVTCKRFDQLSFGQQLQLLDNFNNDFNQRFWDTYNKIYQLNAEHVEHLQVLSQKEKLANLIVRAKEYMQKGHSLYHDDLSGKKTIASIIAYFRMMSTYYSTGTKPNVNGIMSKMNELLELCNEAIVYYETAQEDLKSSLTLRPHPDTNKLLIKCQEEISGLQDTKQAYSYRLKNLKKNTKRK